MGDVRSVEIGGLTPETVRDDAPPEHTSHLVKRRRSLGERLASFSRARELLETAFGSLATERIIEQVPDEAALQVKLLVSYLSTSREVDRTGLGNLGIALRNLDDGEVRIRGKNGSLVRGEARLHEPVTCQRMRENGNLLNLDDVHTKLMDLHNRFVDEGRISD